MRSRAATNFAAACTLAVGVVDNTLRDDVDDVVPQPSLAIDPSGVRHIAYRSAPPNFSLAILRAIVVSYTPAGQPHP